MNTTVKVEGLAGIEDALAKFAPNLVRKSFKKAMHAADEPIIEAAKGHAPILKKPSLHRYPGELRDSIKEQITIRPKDGSVRAKVGPERIKGGTNQDPGAWGLMEEFGSIHNPPQPYLRPAFDAKKDEAVEKFANSLREDIEGMR